MSRIGNLPIRLPQGVGVEITKENLVTVKGPKGILQQQVADSISVSIENNEVVFQRKTEKKQDKAFHGLYRTLVNNMVIGVSEGYKKELELIGVGYRATNTDNVLDLVLGFSHHYVLELPPEIKIITEQIKGKPPKIILESIDKQLLGQMANKIRSLRKPEPYKGKGIRFLDEIVRTKAGKTAQKK